VFDFALEKARIFVIFNLWLHQSTKDQSQSQGKTKLMFP
jgi:hypothetical protein